MSLSEAMYFQREMSLEARKRGREKGEKGDATLLFLSYR
jgi:hypothetical protein